MRLSCQKGPFTYIHVRTDLLYQTPYFIHVVRCTTVVLLSYVSTKYVYIRRRWNKQCNQRNEHIKLLLAQTGRLSDLLPASTAETHSAPGTQETLSRTGCCTAATPTVQPTPSAPPYYGSFLRSPPPPQMVVFGDSSSDAGRRFNAPASFDFDGIGPFPWEMLFEDPDCDVSAR